MPQADRFQPSVRVATGNPPGVGRLGEFPVWWCSWHVQAGEICRTTMTDVNLGRASETSNDIRDIPLIFVKAHSVAANESNQHYWSGRAGRGRPRRPTRRDRVMLITICRLYDSRADANRVALALEAAGVPPSETSVISNNSDTWYKANKTAGPVAP